VKINSIDIEATIEKAQSLIREDKQLSVGARSMFEILILIISLLANQPSVLKKDNEPFNFVEENW